MYYRYTDKCKCIVYIHTVNTHTHLSFGISTAHSLDGPIPIIEWSHCLLVRLGLLEGEEHIVYYTVWIAHCIIVFTLSTQCNSYANELY